MYCFCELLENEIDLQKNKLDKVCLLKGFALFRYLCLYVLKISKIKNIEIYMHYRFRKTRKDRCTQFSIPKCDIFRRRLIF